MKSSTTLREKSIAGRCRAFAKFLAVTGISCALPLVAHASVEGSLAAVQEKMVNTLLPLGAICGLGYAGLSFVFGHPNARRHLFCAIIGSVVGFGAESIIAMIRSIIH